jgi:uncharacterized membrane protein (UPF0136 family)
MRRFKGFLTALLLLLLLLMLTLKMKLIFGWSPDFIFAFLIAAGFTLGLGEALFLGAFAAWLLNFSPLPGFEIWTILALPLLAYVLRRFVPWRPWMSLSLLAVLGLAVWYFLIPGAWASFYPWLILDMAIAVAAVFSFSNFLGTFSERY